MKGTWTLTIHDMFAPDGGMLDAWGLQPQPRRLLKAAASPSRWRRVTSLRAQVSPPPEMSMAGGP